MAVTQTPLKASATCALSRPTPTTAPPVSARVSTNTLSLRFASLLRPPPSLSVSTSPRVELLACLFSSRTSRWILITMVGSARLSRSLRLRSRSVTRPASSRRASLTSTRSSAVTSSASPGGCATTVRPHGPPALSSCRLLATAWTPRLSLCARMPPPVPLSSSPLSARHPRRRVATRHSSACRRVESSSATRSLATSSASIP
mmetsp:Transcript_24316/g.30155  ORF Transcript_24316/g.30155 Transcript_24316/m.30155 type:complete len:203 (-) Transcript_24316:549-1157(-)